MTVRRITWVAHHGVPCFGGSFASDEPIQDHRESMRTPRDSHAFAVILPALRFCKGSAKAWHPSHPKTLLILQQTLSSTFALFTNAGIRERRSKWANGYF